MKKLTHSESEIIKSVNELEAGISADVICRNLNFIQGNSLPVEMPHGFTPVF